MLAVRSQTHRGLGWSCYLFIYFIIFILFYCYIIFYVLFVCYAAPAIWLVLVCLGAALVVCILSICEIDKIEIAAIKKGPIEWAQGSRQGKSPRGVLAHRGVAGASAVSTPKVTMGKSHYPLVSNAEQGQGFPLPVCMYVRS